MSVITSENSKKWITSFIVVVALLSTFIAIRFIEQMADWFDLEAQFDHFTQLSQGVGILFGIMVFVFIQKSKKYSVHLQEVYDELVKVVWPDKDSVVKLTIGIVIGLTIVSGIFVAVDFGFQKILALIY